MPNKNIEINVNHLEPGRIICTMHNPITLHIFVWIYASHEILQSQHRQAFFFGSLLGTSKYLT
jgi:hypothetical protein